MRKPIEAGCQAYVLPGKTNYVPAWIEVSVIRYEGAVRIENSLIRNAWEIQLKDGRKGAVTESSLLRIDDPDIQKSIESEKSRPHEHA